MLTLLSRVMMAASLLFALAPNASADDYPNRPVRLIIPFPPGGSNDVVGRLVAQQLSVKLGHQVYVDNRGGAGGTIGTEACANAAPDGYTICIISIAHAVNPALYPLKYDPIKSFTPISIFATGPNVLVVNPTSPIRSVKDLIALAKEKPGSLNYASAGVGSPLHLAAELFKKRAGIDMVHVPYKGGGPAAASVLAGETQVLFGSVASSMPQVKAGRLKALATTGAKRSKVAPELPTIAESGFPGFDVSSWYAFLVPARTPMPIVNRIRDAAIKAVSLPDVVEQMGRQGLEVETSTPADLAARVKTETRTWADVIKSAGIKAE